MYVQAIWGMKLRLYAQQHIQILCDTGIQTLLKHPKLHQRIWSVHIEKFSELHAGSNDIHCYNVFPCNSTGIKSPYSCDDTLV
jgi:hypothetical protein